MVCNITAVMEGFECTRGKSFLSSFFYLSSRQCFIPLISLGQEEEASYSIVLKMVTKEFAGDTNWFPPSPEGAAAPRTLGQQFLCLPHLPDP